MEDYGVLVSGGLEIMWEQPAVAYFEIPDVYFYWLSR
jgi:hypothetical protein